MLSTLTTLDLISTHVCKKFDDTNGIVSSKFKEGKEDTIKNDWQDKHTIYKYIVDDNKNDWHSL